MSDLKPGNTYYLRIPGGGVVSQVPGRWGPNEVHIRPRDGANNQKWRAEADHSRFGFRNQNNQRLLGSNENGDLQATASELRGWESFSISTEGDHTYLSLYKDNWYNVKNEEDYLKLSDHYTPLIFELA
uniref:Ricin B lectin domain-containing protein n=1 Tax=Bionectria ochroleuca TaxID=29856 RepID=A0A8H7TN57_BIOOC